MLRSKKSILIAIFWFLITEILLSICIFQINTGYGAFLRFLTVLLACLFCVVFIERSWKYVITQIAFIMAFCGDIFLVLPPDPLQLPGVLFFTLSHLAYAVLLLRSETRQKYRKAQLVLRVSLSVIAITLTPLVLRNKCDTLALISVFYYVHLILNFCFACVKLRESALMAAGFFLYILSDTILGLNFVEPYFTLARGSVFYSIIQSDLDLIWGFYVPAQMLLSFSLLPERWKKLSALQKNRPPT